jgi:restriction endonuclease Mrr
MNFDSIKSRLIRLPGASHAKDLLVRQGHTEAEAEMGGLAAAGLIIFLLILLFNSFLAGIILVYFNNLWVYAKENPTPATLIGFLVTIVFLGIFFRFLHLKEERRKKEDWDARYLQHRVEEKRQFLRKGAMGNFEEVFRFYAAKKIPGLEIKSIHVTDTIPRVRFTAKRFNTELGGDVDANFQKFRENLLVETAAIVDLVFELSESIPAVIVDGMMHFINRGAKFYDGPVLSLKATREVYLQLDRTKKSPFKILSSFDFRYNDGMEVEPIPEGESKTARLLEKLRENAPKLNVRYETAVEKVADGWERPKETNSREEIVPIDTMKDKQLNDMPLAQFQSLVVQLVEKLGFEVKGVKKVPGGTLQVQADFSHPILGGSFLVLSRQFPAGSQVHADLVRELDEVTREESCRRGIYFVTSDFTEEARNNSKKLAVDLVDGRKFRELLEGPPYDTRWTIRVVDEKGVVMDLSSMSILAFQEEVDQFLKSMGFQVSRIRRAPGGAVVAVAEHPHPVTGGKFAVLAKQFPATERVAQEQVSEFAHVMKSEFCHRGLLLVTCDTSREAQALARFSGVEIVDRNVWENLRRHRDLGG